ncbi:MAG: phage Gp37/Gp68 family protein [Planctomycetaceae bacterium]|nr:phage Gp37/Gp68 family protein [Planctomycetaceae bacterium]
MADKSHIEWTDATWNPVVGCDKVSPGCAHCYAERVAKRLQAMGKPGYEGVVDAKGRWTGRLNVVADRLLDPIRWKRPRKVFVNSMSDLFHPNVPRSTIAAVFGVMATARPHKFQVLTKRAGRMREIVSELTLEECLNTEFACLAPDYLPDWPLKNVWLGVSVENQATADDRVPLLLDTPAAVRWLSCEPLLGPLDLTDIPAPTGRDGLRFNALRHDDARYYEAPTLLDWVVVGGESGHRARPMHPDWARSLRDQCRDGDVPFFFKQWGEWAPADGAGRIRAVEPRRISDRGDDLTSAPELWCSDRYMTDAYVYRVGKKAAGRLLDGRTWDEFPKEAS